MCAFFRRLAVWVLAAALLLSCHGGIAAQLRKDEVEVEIEGVVVDRSGAGLPAVRVIVVGGSGQMRTTKTDKDGQYKLKVDPMAVLSIKYDHSEGQVVLTRLCGRHPQRISLVCSK